ncbi:MAG TPA: manganese efflux pump MntP family protein [Methanobacterium sp.]|jgi:putative Mn2+ efflux pump MntP|nr:manganese efflux pump MntP family protein [Methanobacterium sp.]
MDIISIIFLSIGLAMDAFSISITLGLSQKMDVKQASIIAIFFGGFQFIMPILGWISGIQLHYIVSTFAPWFAFFLLVAIGGKMIYEAFSAEEKSSYSISLKEILILSVATSIDAFAVGVTFAFLNVAILFPVIMIGLITFILSFIGIYIGKNIGHLFENKMEIVGGVILIILGFKILLENIVI